MRKIVLRKPLRVIEVPDQLEPRPQEQLGSTQPQPTTEPPVSIAPAPDKMPAPARFDWLCAAAQEPGKAAQLAMMLAWQASQIDMPRVQPKRRVLRRFGISRDACYDGLKRLEDAGLVHVWRLPGRLPQVILVEPGTDRPLSLR